MKKIVLLVFLILALSFPAYAGDETGLPENVREEIRGMIRMGVEEDRAVEIAETMEKGKFDGPARVKVRETVREAVAR